LGSLKKPYSLQIHNDKSNYSTLPASLKHGLIQSSSGAMSNDDDLFSQRQE